MERLFFDLIQVSIGRQNCLSRTPSEEEWGKLYSMAKRQSLVGVCFAGVQKLNSASYDNANDDDNLSNSSNTSNLSELQYLTWMGMAAKIQQKNEVVNRQCAELQVKLSDCGLRSCILKGQGVAQVYTGSLRDLRQSGDIDTLLWKDGLSQSENREAVIQLARKFDKDATGSEHHVHAHFFEESSTNSGQATEVELHYEPSYFCNPWANRRFRRWCEEHRSDIVMCEALGCMVPSAEYNLVFLLSHTFRHYVSQGVGLRQLMDYYFVLKTISNTPLKVDDLKNTLDSFNMLKFASAVMWVMKEVFGLEEQFMICEPNERLGRKFLAHVMQGGNFGHHNTETVACKTSHVGRFINQLTLDLSLAIDYPSEALWSPISMIREFLRIRL